MSNPGDYYGMAQTIEEKDKRNVELEDELRHKGCEAGCMCLDGYEVKHDVNCQFYPESLTKISDDKGKRITELGLLLSKQITQHTEDVIERDKTIKQLGSQVDEVRTLVEQNHCEAEWCGKSPTKDNLGLCFYCEVKNILKD